MPRTRPSTPQPLHPELAAVRVHGITRQDFLLRGTLAAAASYGAGGAGPFLARALAQEGLEDVNVTRFALRFEIVEVTYYERAVRRVGNLSGEVREIAKEVRDSEVEHVDLLTALLEQLGGRPDPRPKLDFGDAFRDQTRFLRLAQTLEETGVGSYNGAGPTIQSVDVLETIGRIVQVEARHAAVIRSIRGEEIAPSAFDEALREEQVVAVLEPFIKS
jgi:rubrerythrin